MTTILRDKCKREMEVEEEPPKWIQVWCDNCVKDLEENL
jgi:hypothetical protein